VQELKGNNIRLAVKKYFYNHLLEAKPEAQQFEIYSAVIDKTKVLPLIKDSQNKHRLYNTIAKDVLDLIDFSEVNEPVILYIDRCKGSKEQRIFDKYITDHLGVKLQFNISLDIQHKISHDLSGLQAVDLFCYGIIRKYSDNDTSWYDCFSKKIVKEILWEPKF